MASKTRKSDVHTASSTEALAFIESLQERFAGKIRTPADRERLRDYLAEFEAEELRSVARRVMIDLVAPPVQPDAKRPSGNAKPAKARTRRPRAKS
jgi:hypothetical protein